MTRSATGQDWNCVDRLMDWTGRGGRVTKAGWHISRLPESELFSSPDESTVPAVQCSPETQSLLQAKAGLQQNCHMDYPGTFQISPPSTRPFHSGLSPQLCHNSSLYFGDFQSVASGPASLSPEYLSEMLIPRLTLLYWFRNSGMGAHKSIFSSLLGDSNAP